MIIICILLYFFCQSLSSDDTIMGRKLKRSHQYLANINYLLEQVKNSTKYLVNETNQRKLLGFVINFYEAVNRYNHVYFGYKKEGNLNKFSDNPCDEIIKSYLYLQDICRIAKTPISVLLRDDPKSQDILAKIMQKFQDKIQKYLVHIDFFNKEMYNRCTVEKDISPQK